MLFILWFSNFAPCNDKQFNLCISTSTFPLLEASAHLTYKYRPVSLIRFFFFSKKCSNLSSPEIFKNILHIRILFWITCMALKRVFNCRITFSPILQFGESSCGTIDIIVWHKFWFLNFPLSESLILIYGFWSFYCSYFNNISQNFALSSIFFYFLLMTFLLLLSTLMPIISPFIFPLKLKDSIQQQTADGKVVVPGQVTSDLSRVSDYGRESINLFKYIYLLFIIVFKAPKTHFLILLLIVIIRTIWISSSKVKIT